MSVNFDIDAQGVQSSSFAPNYFHMLDEALVFHTMDLSDLKATKKNKTFLVKELLTSDGVFDKVLFDFINWIISENDREIFLSKTCHVKFIHTKANQDLLKIFVHSDSRCLLNFGHKLWVHKCFTGWKKKCAKDNKTAEVEKVDRMLKELDDVFGQNSYDTDDSTVTFEPPARTPPRIKAKTESPEKSVSDKPFLCKKDNMENEAPHPFDPDVDLAPNRGGGGGYYGPPPPGPPGYYGGYNPHQSGYPPMGGGFPCRPSMDMDLYYAAELGRDLVQRKSMSQMGFTGGSSMFNADLMRQEREIEFLKSSRDMEILSLKRELSLKQTVPYSSSRAEYGVAARDSNDPEDDSTVDGRDADLTEQKRLEKALRDMMDYYDKALQAKDEQINDLQKEITLKGDQFAESMAKNMRELEEARKFYVNDLETTGRESNETEVRVQKELQFMKQSYEKLIATNDEKQTELRTKLEDKNEKLERAFGRIRKTLKDRTETFAAEKSELEAQLATLKSSVENNDADKAALVASQNQASDKLREELDAKLAQFERNLNVEKELVELDKRRLEREMRELQDVLAEKDLMLQRASEKHLTDMEERAKVVERYENILSSKETDYSKMRRDMLFVNEKLTYIESDNTKNSDIAKASIATSYEERRLQMEEELRQLKDSQKNNNALTAKKIQQELEKVARSHEADMKFHTAAFNDERNRLKLRMQSLKESYESETKSLREQVIQKSEQLTQKTATNAASLEEARNAYLRELESKSASVDSAKHALNKELSDLQERYSILKDEMEVVMRFDQDRSDYIAELEEAIVTLQQDNDCLDTELNNIRGLYYQQKIVLFPKIASSEVNISANPIIHKVFVPAERKPTVDSFTQVTVPIMSMSSTQTEQTVNTPSPKKSASVEAMPSPKASEAAKSRSVRKSLSTEQATVPPSPKASGKKSVSIEPAANSPSPKTAEEAKPSTGKKDTEPSTLVKSESGKSAVGDKTVSVEPTVSKDAQDSLVEQTSTLENHPVQSVPSESKTVADKKQNAVSTVATTQQTVMLSAKMNRQDSFPCEIIDHDEHTVDTCSRPSEYMPIANSIHSSPTTSPTANSQPINSCVFKQYTNMTSDSVLKSNSIAECDMGEDFPLKVPLSPVRKSLLMKVPKAAVPAPYPSPAPAAFSTTPSSPDSQSEDRIQQRYVDVQRAKLHFQQKLKATESLINSANTTPVASPERKIESPVKQSPQQLCTRYGVIHRGIFEGGQYLILM